MSHLVFTVGNTRPQLILLIEKDGEMVDLSDATTIDLRLVKPDGTELNKVMTVEDAASGHASVYFNPADLDIAGIWTAELRITWDDGRIQNARKPFPIEVRNEHEGATLP